MSGARRRAAVLAVALAAAAAAEKAAFGAQPANDAPATAAPAAAPVDTSPSAATSAAATPAPARATGGTPESLFAAGNAAYEEEHFQEAVAAYQKVLGFGISDPRVLYNLGNAWFRIGRLGPAILNYERSLRLDPSDREARDNLELCRGLIRDRVGEPELQYPIRVVKDTLEEVPAPSIAWLFLGCAWAAAAAAAAIPLARSWIGRRLSAYALVALGLVALTVGVALLYRGRQDAAPIAIVLEDRIDVRSGPGEENTILFTVHEGTRVDLHNSLERWVQVSLPNGLSGWVPATAIEKV
jgi:tetratricopeptide (TPR) repeat protein